MTIVDVGANIGLTAYYFKDYAWRVFAVEPSRVHLQSLQELVDYNHITNISILPFAISNVNSPVYFYHNTNKTMFSLNPSIATRPDETEIVMAIDMETLFNLIKVKDIDILKLDPEGAEGDIIQSESFKKVCPHIKIIIGELHAWSGLSPIQFQKIFEELGYDFKWIGKSDAYLYVATRK